MRGTMPQYRTGESLISYRSLNSLTTLFI